MRILIPTLCSMALLACAPPPIPNSGAGVGFDGYNERGQQRAERDAALTGSINNPNASEISGEPLTAGTTLPTTNYRPNQNHSGISDEQDFGAVSGRQSIESDKQRIAANRDAFQVIQPTALPTRSGGSGPSAVAYALSSTNAVGQSVYKRGSLSGQSRFTRNCAKYASSDQAQVDFLRTGGPQSDRKGLDPDGDGFACYWDPTPFRQAVSN